MKHAKFLLILIAFSTILISCEKEPKDILPGVWKVENVETSANMTKAEKEVFSEGIEDQKRLLTYNFKAEVMVMKYGEEETEWNWFIFKNGDSLKLSLNTEERKLEYYIKEISEKKIVWEENVYDEYNVITTLKKENK